MGLSKKRVDQTEKGDEHEENQRHELWIEQNKTVSFRKTQFTSRCKDPDDAQSVKKLGREK